jgi:hypothetical protein
VPGCAIIMFSHSVQFCFRWPTLPGMLKTNNTGGAHKGIQKTAQ